MVVGSIQDRGVAGHRRGQSLGCRSGGQLQVALHGLGLNVGLNCLPKERGAGTRGREAARQTRQGEHPSARQWSGLLLLFFFLLRLNGV